jgi:shikimate dehydrogenase
MKPDSEACLVPERFFKAGMVVMDIVYNPLETKLLERAERRGCLTISGLEMLIYQGAEQFRLWTGLTPPLAAMTRAVKEALSRQASDRTWVNREPLNNEY